MIKSSVADRIADIELARLDKKNAFTGEMYASLAGALAAADADAKVRVVVLHGTNDCCSSGNDVNDFL